MSTNGNIQYLADTLLLEKLFRIEEGITKQAGLVDAFKNAANSIKEQVAARVEKDGLGVTLVNYIAPAVLGRIWPPLGIIATLAGLWGVNIGEIMNGMMGSLKDKISSGKLLTMSEINDAGKSAAGGMDGADDFVTEANDDFLCHLRQIETNGKLTSLVREAQQYRSWSGAFKAAPNLRGSGGVLGRIFGNIGRGKGKWLLIGIVIWFVKTVLLGAGVVEGTEAAAKATGVKDKVEELKTNINSNTKTNEEHGDTIPATYVAPAVSLPNSIPHNFKPSGQGQQYHLNDGQSIWIIPLLNGDVADTLISWALSVFPEVQGREDEIRALKPFNNMVSIMSNGISSQSPNYLTVPKGLTSRKQIVEKFLGALPKKELTNVL